MESSDPLKGKGGEEKGTTGVVLKAFFHLVAVYEILTNALPYHYHTSSTPCPIRFPTDAIPQHPT